MRSAPPLCFAKHDQHGAAALVVVMILLFATALAVAFTHRNLVFEQRSSSNQYRATQAFEAAEAGIEWALAQLNANQRIGDDCLPSADAAATSFRMRYLSAVHQTGMLTPTTWRSAGTPTPLHASCVRAANGWSCSCPAQGWPNLESPRDAAPAFMLHFLPASKVGVVRVAAIGCSSLAGSCLAGSTTRPEATSTIEVAFGLVAGLRTPPAATVTTRAGFDAGSAPIGLHNTDPSTAIAVDAGGVIHAPQARMTPPAGGSITEILADHDAALAALPADRLFAAHFGVDKAAWQAQPAVTRIACTVDCARVLGAAIATAADGVLIHVEGNLTLAGPLTLGTSQRPVAIVVNGAARLDGAVAIQGLLYAASITWNHMAGDAFVRGALVSEAGYEGDGAPDLFYDAGVLELLTHTTGSFARVGGSWRDF